MDEGLVCCSCEEWFSVIYNTGSVGLCYCPLCGHEFLEEELVEMVKKAEEE